MFFPFNQEAGSEDHSFSDRVYFCLTERLTIFIFALDLGPGFLFFFNLMLISISCSFSVTPDMIVQKISCWSGRQLTWKMTKKLFQKWQSTPDFKGITSLSIFPVSILFFSFVLWSFLYLLKSSLTFYWLHRHIKAPTTRHQRKRIAKYILKLLHWKSNL